MTLSAHQRVAFARQLLLPEIGKDGQERLLQASARFDGPSSSLANEYLLRAGMRTDEGETSLDGDLARDLAGDAALVTAASAIVAAFSAVEEIKNALGRERAPFPPTYRLLPSPSETD